MKRTENLHKIEIVNDGDNWKTCVARQIGAGGVSPGAVVGTVVLLRAGTLTPVSLPEAAKAQTRAAFPEPKLGRIDLRDYDSPAAGC